MIRPEGIDAFVETILGASVKSENIAFSRTRIGESGFFELLLDDQSTVRLWFDPETGRLANGLQIPQVLLIALKR